MLTLAAIALSVGLTALGCERNSGQSQSTDGTAERKTDDQWPNKVVFAFQPQENPGQLRPDADRMAEFMSDRLGVKAEVFLPTSYAAVVEGLRSKNADVAYFSGWPYLIASRKVGVDLLVVEQRDGQPFYHSQWYVDADSDVKSVSDLEGRSVAFTSPTSTCGYLFPLARVIEETSMETGDDPKSFFSDVIYAGGYQQALQALLHDRVEAAAAADYAPKLYLSNEERDSLRVLSKQGPVPTHGVAVRSALPDPLKEKIREAFLALNDPKHRELLKSLYGAEKLVERSHEEHVGALADALETVGEDREIEGFGAGSGSGHGHEPGSGSGAGEGSGSSKGPAPGSGAGSGSGSNHHE